MKKLFWLLLILLWCAPAAAWHDAVKMCDPVKANMAKPSGVSNSISFKATELSPQSEDLLEFEAGTHHNEPAVRGIVIFEYHSSKKQSDFHHVFTDNLVLARKGDMFAQYNLGLIYRDGMGVPPDPEQALEWFAKAAEQGYAPAQFALGSLYYTGMGTERDYETAFSLFQRAAAQDHALAQYTLGIMYDSGRGVRRNELRALDWYRLSAANGCALAQYNLGVIYYRGRLVQQDYAVALEWYTKAAEQNDAEAQYNLGLMYYRGQGTAKNLTEAFRWLTMAAQNGVPDAEPVLTDIIDEMDAEAVGAARNQAMEKQQEYSRIRMD